MEGKEKHSRGKTRYVNSLSSVLLKVETLYPTMFVCRICVDNLQS